jgi:signal transduction histidine kinase
VIPTDVVGSGASDHSGVHRAFSFLASRRWAGVGLALVVETPFLVGLAFTDSADDVGVPAAVAAAVGGTVAVVFGVWEGVGVAFAGGLVFVGIRGWGTGELLALVVWPAVVAAAGLFGGRVFDQRQMLRTVIAGQERERQRLALLLHDDTAQTLAGALMSLESAEHAAAAGEGETAGRAVAELLRDTIRKIREIAVELRPSALDDFGLVAAVERLCRDFQERTGIAVTVDGDLGQSRLPIDTELALYRAVQETVANAAVHANAHAVTVKLRRTRDGAAAVVRDDGTGFDPAEATLSGHGLAELRDRTQLLGGSLVVASSPGRGTTVTVEIPS